MSREVLLIEGSPGDFRLTREAFREASGSIRLHLASDGVEAMAFLRRERNHARAPRLDFNLPRMDGREVLSRIKGDESLKTIPTIVLTTSSSEEDIVGSYQLQANSYLSKPVQLEEFEGVVRSIDDSWLKTAKLP